MRPARTAGVAAAAALLAVVVLAAFAFIGPAYDGDTPTEVEMARGGVQDAQEHVDGFPVWPGMLAGIICGAGAGLGIVVIVRGAKA